MDNIEESDLNDVFRRMKKLRADGHSVNFTLYSDGSGKIRHGATNDESARLFRTTELLLHRVKEIEEKGFMS